MRYLGGAVGHVNPLESAPPERYTTPPIEQGDWIITDSDQQDCGPDVSDAGVSDVSDVSESEFNAMVDDNYVDDINDRSELSASEDSGITSSSSGEDSESEYE